MDIINKLSLTINKFLVHAFTLHLLVCDEEPHVRFSWSPLINAFNELPRRFSQQQQVQTVSYEGRWLQVVDFEISPVSKIPCEVAVK